MSTSSLPPKVEVRDVHLDYFASAGETKALAGVSFAVAPGEFVAIIGPSGCGKSSLLSLLAGLIAPTRGNVLVNRRQLSEARCKVGYMLQHDHLFEWRTVLDNAMLGAEIQHLDLNAARDRAKNLLSACGLASFFHHLPRELSGGMRQRAALVRTLVTDPEIVLLDEPFSALDAQTRLVLADEVAAMLRQAGKTVVLVTHDIGEAVSMADRVLVISQRPGRIIGEHAIRFGDEPGERPSPFEVRATAAFNAYFAALWEETRAHAIR